MCQVSTRSAQNEISMDEENKRDYLPLVPIRMRATFFGACCSTAIEALAAVSLLRRLVAGNFGDGRERRRAETEPELKFPLRVRIFAGERE